MFLKRIEVFGFKSFMNKQNIEFGDGITCVIGPNGCGKSNISDAIRWVLGETNPRLLRGETMDDVIFNGTRSRKPLGMAEVSLILSNETHVFPIDYSEIRVTRRVYRSGLSEYLINKAPCRLKDIRNLLMDTGLGSSTYTVMERGMTDQLLGNTSVNLRIMLEEAAGIMKYKTQEKLALRKLDATQNDLYRIRDIVAEVEKRVRSLKRQIGKANRFNELSERIRLLALGGGRLEMERLDREASEKNVGHNESRGLQQELTARLAGLEAEVERDTLELRQREQSLREAQGILDKTLGTLEEIGSEILVLDERSRSSRERRLRLDQEIVEATTRIEDTVGERARKSEEKGEASRRLAELREQLSAQKEKNDEVQERVERAKEELLARKQVTLDLFRGESEVRNELGNLETKIQSLQGREQALTRSIEAHERENGVVAEQSSTAVRDHTARTEELANLRTLRDDMEKDLERLMGERAEVAESVVLLRGKRESLGSTHALLTKLRDDYEGYRKGVQSLLTDEEHNRNVIGVVGELVEVEPSTYLPAIENALGEALQCVLISDEASALDLLRYLRDDEKGWATLLPKDRFQSQEIEVPAEILEHPDVIGPAGKFISSNADTGTVIRYLLGRLIFVETMETAVALGREERFRAFRFVTPGGEGSRFPGILFGGGSAAEEVGIFERRTRIEELENELKEAAETLAGKLERKQVLDNDFDRCRVEREQLVGELDRAVARVEEASREKQRLQTAHEKGEESMAGLREELKELVAEKSGIDEHLRKVTLEFESIGADGSRADRSLREIEAEMVELELNREESRRRLTESRVTLGAAEERIKSLSGEIDALERREQELSSEVARKREESLLAERSLEEIALHLTELKSSEADLSERKEAETESRDTILVDVNRINEAIREREESARADRKRREECADKVHGFEMRLQEIKLGRENLIERYEEEFNVVESEIRSAEPIEGMGENEIREEVHNLKEAVRRLGPVNLVALDEFDEENDRFEFLKGQEGDLLSARDSLQETIRTVDKKARALFLDTFEKVSANFRDVFGTLFEGGEAELVMLDKENPLESDLEIFARPGQKAPQRIALLSGGERALTAISILFALYLEKPSPFCILDELDAPLDDANVGRFLLMVEQFGARTQFIVITHNRQTMESANYLYGVTMQESGVSRVVSVRLGAFGSADEEEEQIRAIEGGAA